jgi:DNA-binding response OmpR family regulator
MTKILLVDDSPTIHRAVELAFKGENVHVEWADEHAEATEALQKDTYDVVLVDFNFPGIDPYEFLKQAQAKGMRCLLVCSSLDRPDSEKLAAVPGASILRKPFDKKTLQAMLNMTTEKSSGAPAAEPAAPASKSPAASAPVTRPRSTPPPPPRTETLPPLSVSQLNDDVYAELRGGPASTTVVLDDDADEDLSTVQFAGDSEISVDHIDQSPLEFEYLQARVTAPQIVDQPASQVPWDRVEAMVREKLNDYCRDFVEKHLHETMRQLVEDEMKQMDDRQWMAVLSKALREVVHDQFLNVAERVIRQELNQLLKEEAMTSRQTAPRHQTLRN